MSKKLTDFILRDVINKNESKRAAVATRLCCLIMLFYSCVFMGISFVGGSTSGGIIVAAMAIGYIISMSTTYGKDTRLVNVTFNIVTIIGIIASVIWYGWNSGIQHFLFVLVVYNILFVRMSVVLQIVSTICVCAVRFILYFYCRYNSPIFILNENMVVSIQVISTMLVFMALMTSGIIYAIENQETEVKLIRYNKELEKIASTDPLTQLWNRYRLLQFVENYLKTYKDGICSVCLCDIDFFKKVNDTYGHEAGDRVLQEVGKVFMSEMMKQGAVARWGGEEFLIFFTDRNGDDAYTKLESIRSKIKKIVVPFESKEIKITMTFGLVEYDYTIDLDKNIKVADDRLYKGKQNGRDQIVY